MIQLNLKCFQLWSTLRVAAASSQGGLFVLKLSLNSPGQLLMNCGGEDLNLSSVSVIGGLCCFWGNVMGSGAKNCVFSGPRCVRPGSLTREATHTAVSKQRCLAFSARDNHNWSKFAVPCQNNYWDLWPALSVLWSWRWEDSLRLGPIARLMADKYETASVLQCARNVAHNEEISRRYGPGSIARIIARLMAILP